MFNFFKKKVPTPLSFTLVKFTKGGSALVTFTPGTRNPYKIIILRVAYDVKSILSTATSNAKEFYFWRPMHGLTFNMHANLALNII